MTPKELFEEAARAYDVARKKVEAAKMACAVTGHPGPRDCLYDVGGGGPIIELCGTCGYPVTEGQQ